jgi:hypothetical protein
MVDSSRGSQRAAQMVSTARSPMSALEHYGPKSDIALSPKTFTNADIVVVPIRVVVSAEQGASTRWQRGPQGVLFE